MALLSPLYQNVIEQKLYGDHAYGSMVHSFEIKRSIRILVTSNQIKLVVWTKQLNSA